MRLLPKILLALACLPIAPASSWARQASSSQSSPSSGSATESEAGRLTDRANHLFATGDLKGAAQLYTRAIAASPNDAQLHFNLALALGGLGDVGAEQRELERALQLNPALAKAHNQLGLLAIQAGRPTDAEKEFDAAIAANPSYAEALNNLGVLYSQEGKGAEGIEAFRKSVDADPGFQSGYVNLALALVHEKGTSEAEDELNASIQQNPRNPGNYMALGVVRSKSGEKSLAVEAFRNGVELEPSSSDAHLNLGMALVDADLQPEARKEFVEAARLNPNSAGAHLALGHLCYVSGDYDEARKELSVAGRLQPTLEEAFYFWALVERRDNNLNEAIRLLGKAVTIDAGNADAQFLLGQILDSLGKTDEAIAHWKKAVQSDPQQSQALYNLARAAAKAHDPKAQEYLKRFEDLQKRDLIVDRVAQLRDFALQDAKAQNWPDAIRQMHEAIELCGDCRTGAILHKNMAYLYRSTGKLDEAEGEIRKALALDPNDANAQKALADLQSLEAAERPAQ